MSITGFHLQLTEYIILQIYPTDNGGSYSSNPSTPVASPPPLASVNERPLSGRTLLIIVQLSGIPLFILGQVGDSGRSTKTVYLRCKLCVTGLMQAQWPVG